MSCILSSVNAQYTKYGQDRMKNCRSLPLSSVFTVSDEAFALILIKNYEKRWRMQATGGKCQKEWRKDPNYQTKIHLPIMVHKK